MKLSGGFYLLGSITAMPATLLLSGSKNSSKVEGGRFRWSGRTTKEREREIGVSMVVVVAAVHEKEKEAVGFDGGSQRCG